MDVLFLYSDLDQFVFLAADAKLYRMVDAAHPVGFRMVVLEMIVVHMGLLTQTAVSNHRLLIDSMKGASNKEIASLTDQINNLLQKFKR